MAWRDPACRVSQNDVSGLQRRGGGVPAVGQSFVEEFVRGRAVIPDGDRRHDAESGQSENNPAILQGNEQVVAVLVLIDELHVGQGNLAGLHPGENFFDRGEFGNFRRRSMIRFHEAPLISLDHCP